MIFASDLDQTLIYSINFLDKYYQNPDAIIQSSLSLIEYYNGKPLCYIHNNIIDKLKQLDNQGCFIPVTTRTEEQYKRIEFGKFGIHPTYAITSNGAKVLKNGKVDKEWENTIQLKLADIASENKRIIQLVQDIIPQQCIKKIRTAENVFSYIVLHRELFDEQLLPLIEQKSGNAWQVSLQGTKLYLMPSAVSKWNALKYILQQTRQSKVIAAGDSLLDLPLLKNAHLGIIPSHGEIFNQALQDRFSLKVAEGKAIEASIGILKLV